MATVSPVDCVLVSPPGETMGDAGYALSDVTAGELVEIVDQAPPNRTWSHCVQKATGTVAHGVAVKDCKAKGTIEYAFIGEMDGYAGLDPLQPLSIVDGDLDDTAPTLAINDGDTIDFTIPDPHPAIFAVTPTRIRFRLP